MPASPRFLRPFALHCRAGVHARRGGFTAARKGIGKARRRTPQSADADSSPYRGAFRVAVPPKPPLQGEVDAPQGADGGVHCRQAAKMSCKTRQGFARCFVGDDACIVPQTLRCRKAPRRAKSPALHCGRKRALTCKRQPFVRPAGGPMQASAPTQGVAGQRGKLPNAGTPPAVPGPAARLPCIVGRAFTPAGEVCGGPEGYRQGHVPHPSVG